MNEAFCSFTHGQAPSFDLPVCTVMWKPGFEYLVLVKPVASIDGVVHEIGAIGQTEKIGRGKVHTHSLHEIQHIQLPTVLKDPVQYWQETVKYQAMRHCLQILGALQIRFGVDIRNHTFLHRVWLVFQHGDHIGRAIIHKVVKIPVVLFEATDVYGPQRFSAIDTDLIGPKSYYRTMLTMESKKGADACTISSFGPDP